MKFPLFAAVLVVGVRLFAAVPRLVVPDEKKHLVLDSGVVISARNARLAPGTLVKDERNPALHADQPWDAEERVFKLWYKCVLADKDVIAKMDGPSTVHDVGWYLLYAASQDGVAFIPRGPKGTYDSECIYAMSGPAIAQVKCAFP
jgi:hypothetical protein